MPFNTYTFLVFFFILLVFYHLLKSWRLQKKLLLLSSYIFYSAWNPLFVILLIFSTIVDWLLAQRIFNAKNRKSKRNYLILSLLVNLGALSFFKYGDFFLENGIYLLSLININFNPVSLNILLPVGISFYTFQTLSYSIDTYRQKIKPSKSFIDYALYVSFFPQLVAGPIVRANDFLPQCETPRKTSRNQFGWGIALVIIGLFMKIIVADNLLAPVVDSVYDNPENANNFETWIAVFAFSGQIFGDFSGYSTVAIGVALCLGFVLPDNFKAPYAALGFREFWQRWHISLSTWLRDYLYISLGGNKISSLRTSLNLMITMLIGGLWHGASWLFIIWGGLHGFYLIVEHKIHEKFQQDTFNLSPFASIVLMIMTFIIVSLTWVFFRAENFHDAMMIFKTLFHPSQLEKEVILDLEYIMAITTVISLLVWHIKIREKSIECMFGQFHDFLKGGILASMILAIILFGGGDDRAFIYFQF